MKTTFTLIAHSKHNFNQKLTLVNLSYANCKAISSAFNSRTVLTMDIDTLPNIGKGIQIDFSQFAYIKFVKENEETLSSDNQS